MPYRTCKAHYIDENTPCPTCRIRELEAQLAKAQADYDAEAVRLSTAVNAELDRAHKEVAKAKSEIECMRESFCAMREAQASVVRDALTPRSTADPADAELRRAIAEAEVKKLKAERDALRATLAKTKEVLQGAVVNTEALIKCCNEWYIENGYAVEYIQDALTALKEKADAK